MNWNLGTANYAMISNFVNLVTFETCRSTRPPLISQAWALFCEALIEATHYPYKIGSDKLDLLDQIGPISSFRTR